MRAHARRYTVTESGTRHELPDGGLSADRVRELWKLASNQTCAFVRVSYVSEQKAATKLRPIGSALYFLVTPQTPVRLHRVRNDQVYHYYRGDPLELLLLKLDGSSEKAIIGPDLAAGEHVQFFIPGATFRTVRVIEQRRWLLGADVGLGDAEMLAKKYPHVAEEIRSFASPHPSRRGLRPLLRVRSLWRWLQSSPPPPRLAPPVLRAPDLLVGLAHRAEGPGGCALPRPAGARGPPGRLHELP